MVQSDDLFPYLYPQRDPFDHGMLDVGQGHCVYWERHGNKDGIPVVGLHGGPGSSLSSWHAQLYDPDNYQILLFDQRGCGRSTPFAQTKDNTTDHLIRDMEKLRAHFGYDKWHVFGGSWGSTLALAYANTHPEYIQSLIVYGIFLCRDKELQSLFSKDGIAAQLFSDFYQEFLKPLSKDQQVDPITSYATLFQSEDKNIREDALRRWSHWELRVAKLVADDEIFDPANEDMAFLEAHSVMEQHYFLESGFIDGDQILKDIGEKVKDVPVHIIQGRYDFVCPPQTAFELHQAIKHSTLTIIPDAGHSAKETGMMRAIFDIIQNLES